MGANARMGSDEDATVGATAADVAQWIGDYARRLGLEHQPMLVTTDRHEFQRWLGRRISASYGGAYAWRADVGRHLILINVSRLNPVQPRAVELVVAEELIHMRDRIDGDCRRHAKHGYDRIATRVAALTGATLDEIRSCLVTPTRRPLRYRYVCPGCDRSIWRRRRGVWSCGRCASRFDARFQLRIAEERVPGG